MLVFAINLKAQTDYQKTDSIASALYTRGEWKMLLTYGKAIIEKNEDYLGLRLKLADAAFNLGAYSLALLHYQKVLNNDHYQQQALFFSFLCNTYLNRQLDASYSIRNLNEKNINGRIQKSFQIQTLGLENSFKSTNITARGASTYTRLHALIQITENLHIDQSVFFFNQTILTDKIRLGGYYAKLSFMPIKSLTLFTAYNSNSSNDLISNYQNKGALVGVKYSHPYFNLQGDVNFSRLNNENMRQINLQLFNYLSGNLNLYVINRLSKLNTNTVYAASLGTKIAKNIWLEGNATFGLQKNYIDADGLYQFNGIDNTTSKYSTNVYFMIKKHLILTLGYTKEEKESSSLTTNYSQNAINTGIKWNF